MRPYVNATTVAHHITLVEGRAGTPAVVDDDGKEISPAVAPVEAEEVIVGGGERVDLDEKNPAVQDAVARGVLIDVSRTEGVHHRPSPKKGDDQ